MSRSGEEKSGAKGGGHCLQHSWSLPDVQQLHGSTQTSLSRNSSAPRAEARPTDEQTRGLSDPNCEALLGAPAGEELGCRRGGGMGISWAGSWAEPSAHSYCPGQQDPSPAAPRMLTKKKSKALPRFSRGIT